MQDAPKVVWSIPYVSVAFFPSFKHNFIAYRSSSRPDYIFEIPQLWQSGFSRVYSNCCCSSSFEPEIIKIVQASHKMYSNNILDFQESTTNVKACTKKVWKLIEGTTYLGSSSIKLLEGILKTSKREREWIEDSKKDWRNWKSEETHESIQPTCVADIH